MNAPQRTPPHDRTAEAIPLVRWRHGRGRQAVVLLILGLVITGSGLLALHALRPTATPESLPPAQLSEVDAALLQPAPLPAAADEASTRLTRVEERTTELVLRVDQLAASLAELTTSLSAQSDVTAQLRSRLDTLDQRRRSAVRRAQPSKPAKPPKPKLPAIVSVDMWGNQASVAIREADGRLGFYREGDTVGVARIQRIDVSAQQVQLHLPDGTKAVVGVQD